MVTSSSAMWRSHGPFWGYCRELAASSLQPLARPLPALGSLRHFSLGPINPAPNCHLPSGHLGQRSCHYPSSSSFFLLSIQGSHRFQDSLPLRKFHSFGG